VAGYKTQSRDTSPKVERFLIEAYRKMTPIEKINRVMQMSQACSDLARAGILSRYPNANEQEVRLRLAALRLDRKTMINAFGWDPKKEGY